MLIGTGYARHAAQGSVGENFSVQRTLPPTCSGGEISAPRDFVEGGYPALVVNLCATSQVIHQSFQVTYRRKRLRFGAAAAGRLGWIGIRSDDCNRSHVSFIERQKITVIFEQNHSRARRL